MSDLSRRGFLNGLIAAGGLAGLGGLSAGPASAADTGGYKALVCLFFLGGMDFGDTIYPLNQSEYDMLKGHRDGLFSAYAASGSRDLANLLALNADNTAAYGGRRFGMPPQLGPLQQLFNSGELAVVGNVGPLIEPTSRAAYEGRTVALPKHLFSHNDQQSTWMALSPEGEQIGWGGRVADIIAASSPGVNQTFTAISTSGSTVFLAGQTIRQFQLSSGGDVQRPRIETSRGLLGSNAQGNATREQIGEALRRDSFGASSLLERDLARASATGILNNESFATAAEVAGSAITTPFPTTNLGQKMQTVARTIAMRDTLLMNRQVFFVSTGGFDTHSGQSNSLPGLQTQIADAVMAFRNAMIELGQWGNVTVFSGSDFGRTLIANDDGTDHGWGSHHFVAGGAVRGRRLLGTLPSPDIQTESFTSNRGRLIPSVSVEQYGGAIARWFGLSNAELGQVFPNLRNFPSGVIDLY